MDLTTPPVVGDAGELLTDLADELAREYQAQPSMYVGWNITDLAGRIAMHRGIAVDQLYISPGVLRSDVADAIAALYDIEHHNAGTRHVFPDRDQGGTYARIVADPLAIGEWGIHVYYGNHSTSIEYLGADTAPNRRAAEARARELWCGHWDHDIRGTLPITPTARQQAEVAP